MGMFDITPADPLQTQQDFRQTMAKTAALELAPQKIKQDLEVGALGLQKTKRTLEADERFRVAVSGIDPKATPIAKLGEIANIAIREGRASEAEKAMNLASQIEQREAQNSLRGEIETYRKTQAASLRVQRQKDLLPLATSEIGLEAANMTYKEEFGDDMPFYKALKKQGIAWSPQVADAVREALGKQMTAAELLLRQRQAAAGEARAANGAALVGVRAEQIRTRTEQIQDQIDAKRKAGGGKEASMRPIDERTARAIIREKYPELDARGLELAVLTLGDEAKQLQKAKGGMFSDMVQEVVSSRGDQFKRDNSWLFTKPTQFTSTPAAPRTPAAAPAPKPAAQLPAMPRVGEVRKGYRFRGGDPSKSSSWEQVK